MTNQKTAFFIDDDPDFLDTLSMALRHPLFKIETYCAQNGYRAVDEILRVKPDVIFIDFYLPRANGGQVIPIVQSVNGLRKIPVYFLTAYSKDAVGAFLNHLEFGGILEKDQHFIEEIVKILDQLAGTALQGR